MTLPLASLVITLCAQVGAGQVTELPTAMPAGGKVDHAVVAMNDQGDTLVVWSGSVYPLGHPDQVVRRVEAVLLHRQAADDWSIDGPYILGEADPTLLSAGTIYPTGDICRKPDVVAVGNDFLVAWQRISRGSAPNARIEVALVRPTAGGGAQTYLDSPEGIGWAIDSFDPTEAGGMVDLAAPDGSLDQAYAVYASATYRQQLGVNDFAYDFELRATRFAFPVVGAAPTVDPRQILVPSLAYDNFAPGVPRGGRVLPDAVFDPWDQLVVAFEEYTRADRPGSGLQQDESLVHMRRFDLSGAAATEVNRVSFGPSAQGELVRRPNVFRNPAVQRIGLTWAESDLAGTRFDVRHLLAVYPDPSQDAALVNLKPKLQAGIDEQLPVPMQVRTVDSLVAIGETGNGRVAAEHPNTQNRWTVLKEFNGLRPYRPSVAVLPSDPWRSNRPTAAFVFESQRSGFDPRIALEFFAY